MTVIETTFCPKCGRVAYVRDDGTVICQALLGTRWPSHTSREDDRAWHQIVSLRRHIRKNREWWRCNRIGAR